MWEDETIDYGCENGSLVLNRKKGVQYATYKCQDDGTYATPKGKEEGDPWPECTLKPVDPCEYHSLLDNAPNHTTSSWVRYSKEIYSSSFFSATSLQSRTFAKICVFGEIYVLLY